MILTVMLSPAGLSLFLSDIILSQKTPATWSRLFLNLQISNMNVNRNFTKIGPSMVPKEIREFYPNNVKQFAQRNFNYNYSMPLLMNTGRKYDFQLSWNLRNLEQSKKTLSRWYRHDPELKKPQSCNISRKKLYGTLNK